MDKFKIKPTLSQVGATKPIARQQGIQEKVLGTSKRTRDNHNAIINQLEEFRSNYGAATTDEVLTAFVTSVSLVVCWSVLLGA